MRAECKSKDGEWLHVDVVKADLDPSGNCKRILGEGRYEEIKNGEWLHVEAVADPSDNIALQAHPGQGYPATLFDCKRASISWPRVLATRCGRSGAATAVGTCTSDLVVEL